MELKYTKLSRRLSMQDEAEQKEEVKKATILTDIGSWTIDIMPVINKSPDESKCVTIPKGLITCI